MTTPHWFGPPPPQYVPVGQVPQSIVLPQPSPMMPQFAFASAHVRGVHDVVPHVFVPPPPHVMPFGHVPQSRTTPSSQPSPDLPQS